MILHLHLILSVVFLIALAWACSQTLLPLAATALVLRRRPAAARALARISLAMPLGNPELTVPLRSLVAYTLYLQKRYEAALDGYLPLTRSLAVSGDVAKAFLNSGDCHQALGQTDRAQTAWGMAAKRAEALPESYDKYELLEELAKRRKDREASYSYLQRLLDYCTGKHARMLPVHLAMLATDANLLAKHDEALQWCRRLIDSGAAHPMQKLSGYSQAGLANLILGNLEAGRQDFLAMRDLAARTGRARDVQKAEVQLANVEMQGGRIADALKRLESLSGIDGHATLHVMFANCYSAQGRDAEALAIRLKIISGDTDAPWNANTDSMVGTTLIGAARNALRLGRPAEAMEYLQKAAPEMERNQVHRPWFLAVKARALIDSGDPAAAKQLIEEIVGQLPEIAARRLTARACLPSLAEAQIRLGEFEAAKSTLGVWNSVGFNPMYEPLHDQQLGDCERGLGNTEAARAAYERAADRGIETFSARAARERLAELS